MRNNRTAAAFVVILILSLTAGCIYSFVCIGGELKKARAENELLLSRIDSHESGYGETSADTAADIMTDITTDTAEDTADETVTAETADRSVQTEPSGATGKIPEVRPEPITREMPDGITDLPDLIEEIMPTIVSIECTAKKEIFIGSSKSVTDVESSGTGIVMTSDGYIATCWHVVDEADTIEVVFHDGTRYPATLTGKDERFDLAVIRINAASPLQTVTVGDSDTLRPGETMIAIGNAMGIFGNSVSVGVLSAPTRTITIKDVPMKLIQTDTAVNPGNSGGGLFSINGKLIGIVNAKISSSEIEGISFAIPINSVIKKIDDIIRNGYVTTAAYIGLSTENDRFYDRDTSEYVDCIRIVKIEENSPAQKAGLEVGDYITSVDNQTVTDNDDFSLFIYYSEEGDTLTLTVYRDRSFISIDVTLGQKREK